LSKAANWSLPDSAHHMNGSRAPSGTMNSEGNKVSDRTYRRTSSTACSATNSRGQYRGRGCIIAQCWYSACSMAVPPEPSGPRMTMILKTRRSTAVSHAERIAVYKRSRSAPTQTFTTKGLQIHRSGWRVSAQANRRGQESLDHMQRFERDLYSPSRAAALSVQMVPSWI
jgi:hypothetical protein